MRFAPFVLLAAGCLFSLASSWLHVPGTVLRASPLDGRRAQAQSGARPAKRTLKQRTGFATLRQAPSAQGQARPELAQEIRPICPVRLGGAFTMGVGSSPDPFDPSAGDSAPISPENERWIASHCDVVALDADELTPGVFPTITREDPLFTPLLYERATSISELPHAHASVGGWTPALANHVLLGVDGKEVPYPDAHGHWMDFGSLVWAHHWRDQVIHLVDKYHAQGVVAAELPVDNSFVPARLLKYPDMAARIAATEKWLAAVRAPSRYLMVPDALGFDMLAGHATLPPPPGAEEPDLVGRLWDDMYPLVDGAWDEGWVHPYWLSRSVSDAEWERQIEAMDRTGNTGQTFIAAAAYRSAQELEFDLASYLLAYHHQGRMVFQPMPLVPGQRSDAGYSLEIMKREVAKWSGYFNVPLGRARQERHLIPTTGGVVWRRGFDYGAVYVNSRDSDTVTLELGAPMKRLSGQITREITLPPHAAAILLYNRDQAASRKPTP